MKTNLKTCYLYFSQSTSCVCMSVEWVLRCILHTSVCKHFTITLTHKSTLKWQICLPGWQCQFRNAYINHWHCSRHWCLRAEGARVIYCRNSSSHQPSPSGYINIHLRSSEKCFACGYCEKRKSASNFLTYYKKL